MAPWLAPGLWFLAGKRGQKGREGAKNLDVMGFEPMTSGLEPAPLTTRQLGPCLKMVAVRRFWRSEQKVLGGRSDQKLQFSKRKNGFANGAKIFGGAIRPKIANFKEEKWVCYGAKILASKIFTVLYSKK